MDAVALLKTEYGPHIKPLMASAPHQAATYAAPSSALVQALEAACEAYGVPPGSINWLTFIPAVATAVSTGNWLAVITQIIGLVTQYGPGLWTMIQQIIEAFQPTGGAPAKPAPAAGGGAPIITGH